MAVENNKIRKSQIIFSILYILIWPIVILFLSGDWLWIEGWIFSIWFVTLSLAVVIYLYFKDPGLLAERFRKPGTGGEKGWDKYWIYTILIMFIIWLVVMPLDAKRYGWTVNFPVWLKFIGGILLFPAFFFTYRAFVDNPFASSLVRIQTERKQYVVSTGVYGFVRHPMYLGAILYSIGSPMLLGSKYGILLGLIMSFLLVGRIIGEERALVEGLEGYEDYKKKVKYRLIPYIW